MKQLILVLAVHCLMYTANAGSTLPGKSLAETLIDSIPDSPRGSLAKSIERTMSLASPFMDYRFFNTFKETDLHLPRQWTDVLPVSGATAFLALLGGILIGSAKKGATATNSYMRSRASSQKRRSSTIQRREGMIEGFTANLYNLAEAFQKYNVNEPGCQLYVACEASKVQFRRKNGKLAKSVHHILSTIMKPQNTGLYADDLYMKDLVSAFKVGTLGANCAKFRRQCPKPKLG